MKICIRADGGRKIGIGHIMRTMSLANELKKKNQIMFLCKNIPKDVYYQGIKILIDNGFKVFKMESKNILQEINKFQETYEYDMIITDSYDVNEEYFNKIKKIFKKSGYIDDLNNCRMNVDFIINTNVDAWTMDYSETINKNTKLFLGTQYCMLRDEFRKSVEDKIFNVKVKNILLTLGGMDDDWNTLRILRIFIDKVDININIHIVIGSAFTKELVLTLKKMTAGRVNVFLYENAIMSKLMKKSDIAITACGGTLYELCAMKIPSIGIVIAENQLNVAKFMKKNGLLYEVFCVNKINEKNFVKSLQELIDNSELRKLIVDNQSDVINIEGNKILANKIESIGKEI